MVSGRNGEMLMRAAATIEALSQRATSAEQLYHRQLEQSTRNAELREIAEVTSDGLLREVEGLRAQLAEITATGATERAHFGAERGRMLKLMQDAEAHVADVTAEFDALRKSVDAFNETAVAVPIVMLRLARTQFDILSDGFAKNGDVISHAISEIGGCAIDQALAAKKAADS
ncbi:hypothetical protein GCM10007857_74010 [Bradyrhizobium iriomotense]|uniref:Uncharacterized protein n=2 Tax=Bradyrhizobium iriomotense TaxID=441950 RepID=A0ABQ6BA02_9BRAD|nr:hypothetical protein GCM10007857_74010 [Bradyrhizobium iriomotense]